MYILIITDTTDHFQKRTVYGTFNSVEEIKKWIKGKFNNSSYVIDIHPLEKPENKPNLNQNFDLDLDLMKSDYIAEKCKNANYAQNLYASMCNRWFEKNGVKWMTSWRGAGGIVADIRNCGEDYIDWYCSGINLENNEYVSEGTVTEEIAMDLFRLGWTVRKFNYNEFGFLGEKLQRSGKN